MMQSFLGKCSKFTVRLIALAIALYLCRNTNLFYYIMELLYICLSLSFSLIYNLYLSNLNERDKLLFQLHFIPLEGFQL